MEQCSRGLGIAATQHHLGFQQARMGKLQLHIRFRCRIKRSNHVHLFYNALDRIKGIARDGSLRGGNPQIQAEQNKRGDDSRHIEPSAFDSVPEIIERRVPVKRGAPLPVPNPLGAFDRTPGRLFELFLIAQKRAQCLQELFVVIVRRLGHVRFIPDKKYLSQLTIPNQGGIGLRDSLQIRWRWVGRFCGGCRVGAGSRICSRAFVLYTFQQADP